MISAVAVLAMMSADALAADDLISKSSKAKIEDIVRDYILNNPEIVRDALIKLQREEEAQANQAKVAAIDVNREALFRSANDPIAGNPDGSITVVEFFDYNCPYCRRAKPVVRKLLKEDTRVRYVFKEFPILRESSRQAAGIALAIWHTSPEKYWDFHNKLMAHNSTVTLRGIKATVDELGLDWAKLESLAKGSGYHGSAWT